MLDRPAPPETHAIGDWTFEPAAAELRRGGERRRLEDRAARALELLCARRGQVVSNVELLEGVWNGRALSPNSVAVVIKDLRQALDDDARSPRHIETISKRGYRLIADAAAPAAEAVFEAAPGEVAPAAAEPPRRSLLVTAGAVLVLAGLFTWSWFATRPAPPPVVLIETVVNATGDPGQDALARSVGELLVADLSGTGKVTVVRPGPLAGPAPTARIASKLILWTGHPAMTITAHDAGTGAVLWSKTAPGPEPKLPAQIRLAMEELGGRLAARVER